MRPKNLFFGTLRLFLSHNTKVLPRQRRTTLYRKTNPSGVKQFFKSKFLPRQGKKVSNADALRGFLRQCCTIEVYELRSKIFRQGVQKFCRLADASQEVFVQHDGNRFKQGVRRNCAVLP